MGLTIIFFAFRIKNDAFQKGFWGKEMTDYQQTKTFFKNQQNRRKGRYTIGKLQLKN